MANTTFTSGVAYRIIAIAAFFSIDFSLGVAGLAYKVLFFIGYSILVLEHPSQIEKRLLNTFRSRKGIVIFLTASVMIVALNADPVRKDNLLREYVIMDRRKDADSER